MSEMSQESPGRDTGNSTATEETHVPAALRSEESQAAKISGARLKVIRELVRSDCYDVPATLIAERMIERVIAENRDSEDSPEGQDPQSR
jgi:hypothetical protein